MIMRRWRVGSLSMGLILIASGIIMLVSLFVRVNVLDILLTYWPVILICLGIEILLHLFVRKDGDEDNKIRYDVISVLFISFLLIISIGFYAVAFYAGQFESREDMYASLGIMNESITIRGSESLAGTSELVVFNDVGRITVLSASGGELRIDYAATANTSDPSYAEAVLSDVVRVEHGERAYLLGNGASTAWNRRIDWVSTECVVYLPSDVTLDLSQYWGSPEYDRILEGQIIFNDEQ